jgi:hypothetical protein
MFKEQCCTAGIAGVFLGFRAAYIMMCFYRKTAFTPDAVVDQKSWHG